MSATQFSHFQLLFSIQLHSWTIIYSASALSQE